MQISLDGWKDRPSTKWGLGIVAPILLGLIGVLNLVYGKAYLPGLNRHNRHLVVVLEDSVSVLGVVLGKLGVAVFLFGWFYLANTERHGRRAHLVAFTGAGVFIVGIIVSIGNSL